MTFPEVVNSFSQIFNANWRSERVSTVMTQFFSRKHVEVTLTLIFKRWSHKKPKLTTNLRFSSWLVVDSPLYVTRKPKRVPQSRHAGDTKASEWLRISPGGWIWKFKQRVCKCFSIGVTCKTPAHSKQYHCITATEKKLKKCCNTVYKTRVVINYALL